MTEKDFTVEEAAELGAKAYQAGQAGVPIHDAAFMSRYLTTPDVFVGSRLKYLEAYNKAWMALQRKQADVDWEAFLLSEEESENPDCPRSGL
jgi:hypothetical protein